MGVSKAKVLSGGKSGNNDFHKKKAKVGKKVQRSNVTSISLQSKRIIMPTGVAPNIRPTNENEMIDRIIKQLQHYSGINRATALEELKKLMEISTNSENITTMILPHALELLFDEDINTRKSCISLISDILKKFESNIFASITPVLITYICSGLTSLNKGQRRDTLSVLLTFSLNHSSLLIPYLEKLVSHVLALLTTDDLSTSSGQDAIASSEYNFINNSYNNSNANMVLKGDFNKDNTNNSKKYNNKTLKNMLLVILEVLVAILSEGKDFNKIDGILLNSKDTKSENEFTLLNYFRPISNTCKYLHCKQINMKISSFQNDDTINRLPKPLLGQLCSKLSKVWSGLVLNNSIIMLETTNALNEISKITQVLGENYDCTDLNEYKCLITNMFQFFPHISMEASLAVPNSIDEKVGNMSVTLLDISLCKIVLLSLNSDDTLLNKDYPHLNTIVGEFLLSKLQSYASDEDDENDPHIIKESGVIMIDDKDFESIAEVLEMETNEISSNITTVKSRHKEKGRGILWHTRTQFPKMKKRALLNFFSALQLLLFYKIKSDSTSIYEETTMNDTSSLSMANLFSILNTVAIKSISNKVSSNQLLAHSAIKIFCSIVTDDSLWFDGYPPNYLISIVETINSSLDLLINNFMELEYISHLIINSIHRIMQRSSIELLKTIPSYGLFTNTIEILFCNMDSDNKCFYLKCNAQLKYQILDVYYYTSFLDTTKVFNSIIKVMTNPLLSTNDERSYFLSILFERNEDIVANEIINYIILCIRQQLQLEDFNYHDTNHTLHIMMNLNMKNKTAHEIANMLSHCTICEESTCKYIQPFNHIISKFFIPILRYYGDVQLEEYSPGSTCSAFHPLSQDSQVLK